MQLWKFNSYQMQRFEVLSPSCFNEWDIFIIKLAFDYDYACTSVYKHYMKNINKLFKPEMIHPSLCIVRSSETSWYQALFTSEITQKYLASWLRMVIANSRHFNTQLIIAWQKLNKRKLIFSSNKKSFDLYTANHISCHFIPSLLTCSQS